MLIDPAIAPAPAHVPGPKAVGLKKRSSSLTDYTGRSENLDV
jgi:hypothetical protein